MKKISPSPFGTYYEFGVGWGGTLASYFLALEKFCKDHNYSAKEFRIFGFDSFKGLPKSEHPSDCRYLWDEGKMSFPLELIKKKLQTYPFSKNFQNIEFIEGFYDEVLTERLQTKLSSYPPSIVTIDVDLYTSTKLVLDWLRPILMSGAVIYFDDIWSFHGHLDFGQIKAINEFNSENDGLLTSFPTFGEVGKVYIYSRKKYEYN